MGKKYMVYLLRWQLSSPIIAGVSFLMGERNPLLVAFVANLVGGLVFFWVDRRIFESQKNK